MSRLLLVAGNKGRGRAWGGGQGPFHRVFGKSLGRRLWRQDLGYGSTPKARGESAPGEDTALCEGLEGGLVGTVLLLQRRTLRLEGESRAAASPQQGARSGLEPGVLRVAAPRGAQGPRAARAGPAPDHAPPRRPRPGGAA